MRDLQDLAIFPSAELFLIRGFMQQQGWQPRHWLLGSGLAVEHLGQPQLLVSQRQFDIIYRNVFRLSRRPTTGLLLGLAMNLSRWGVVAIALLSARTLGHALSLAGRYRALLRSRFTLSAEDLGGQVALRIARRDSMEYPVNEVFALEFLTGTLQTQIANLLAIPFHFQGIHLVHAAPSYWREVRELVGCEVLYGAADNLLVLRREELEQPLPLRNPLLQRQALRLCEAELARVNREQEGHCLWLVRGALARYPDSVPSMRQIATALGCSERTLRRRLAASQASFQELQRQHQLQVALSGLGHLQTTVATVAAHAGFRDEGSFRQAFKRWTGLTPTQYRRQNRPDR